MAIVIALLLSLAACASPPNDPHVLAYCSSAMLERGQVGLFDARIPCLVLEAMR